MVARLFRVVVQTAVLVHAVVEMGVLVPYKVVVQKKVHRLAPVDKEDVGVVAVVAESCQWTLPLVLSGEMVALEHLAGHLHETCRLPKPDRECPTTPIRALSYPLGTLPGIWEGEA